jgi:flagellar hook assembly protein FlgD
MVASATTVVKHGARPAGPGLDRNYPNPFNPTTTITYRLANPGRVSLKVYDQTGREVATLADGTERSGDHAITWNASGMASGMYYCRFVTSDGQWTARMVLLK